MTSVVADGIIFISREVLFPHHLSNSRIFSSIGLSSSYFSSFCETDFQNLLFSFEPSFEPVVEFEFRFQSGVVDIRPVQ